MPTITKQVTIAGSSFHKGAGNWIMKLRGGEQLRLEREPNNPRDPNAISVHIFQQQLGYVTRGLAEELAPKIDAGLVITARKSPVIGAVMILTWDEPEVNDDPAA